jgi:hypothetical protein
MELFLLLVQAIGKCMSCRTFDEIPVKANVGTALDEFLQSNTADPFGCCLRLKLIDLTENERSELRARSRTAAFEALNGAPDICGTVLVVSCKIRQFFRFCGAI